MLSLLLVYFQIHDEQLMLWGQAVWGNDFCIHDQREVASGYKNKIDLTLIIATGVSNNMGCVLPEECVAYHKIMGLSEVKDLLAIVISCTKAIVTMTVVNTMRVSNMSI